DVKLAQKKADLLFGDIGRKNANKYLAESVILGIFLLELTQCNCAAIALNYGAIRAHNWVLEQAAVLIDALVKRLHLVDVPKQLVKFLVADSRPFLVVT